MLVNSLTPLVSQVHTRSPRVRQFEREDEERRKMKFSKVCTLAGGVAIAASTLLIVPTESAQAATCK